MAQTAATRPFLEDGADSALDWMKANMVPLAIGGLVVVVAVLGYAFFSRSSAIKEGRAEQALMSAGESYRSGNLPLAQSDLEKMIQRYKGTDAADQGALLLAQIHFDQGKVADGLKALEQAPSTGTAGAAAEALRAAALEAENKPAEAADKYLAAAQKAPAGATRIWEELAKDQQSFYAAEARVRIGELTAKPATR